MLGLVISPYAKRGYIDHQTLSFDGYVKLIEDKVLKSQRLTQDEFVLQKCKEAAERRREETHAARQKLQHAKLEPQQIRNRIAAAKAEALELKNFAEKSNLLSAAATYAS